MGHTQPFQTDIISKRLALFYFLVTFSVERGVFVFFLKEHGYTLIEIGLLQTIFSASLFLFELPSGYLADKFGRTTALATGGLTAGISLWGQFLLVSSMPLTIACFSLYALSFSLISGSLSSALYKNLNNLDALQLYSRHYATIQFAGSLSLGLAMISAAPILETGGWKAIYTTSIIMSVLSVIAVAPLAITEISNTNTTQHTLQLDIFLKELIAITPIALPFATIHAAMTPYFLYASSSFHESGMSKGAASAAVGTVEIISAMAGMYAARFIPNVPAHAIPALMIMTSVIIAGNPFYSPTLSIVAFLTANTLTLWAAILTNNLINSTIKAEHLRTTTLSAASFLDMLFISAGFITYGIIAESHPSTTSLIVISLYPLTGALLLIATFKVATKRGINVLSK
ncbi:MFS transporter [Pseudomonas silvicola]|nr:MFS transporter [Pseudomonas silvicola]